MLIVNAGFVLIVNVGQHLATGATRAVLTGHQDAVTAVACTTIGGQPVAVTAGRDETVRVWDGH